MSASLSSSTALVPVIFAPAFDPAAGVRKELPPGLTIEQIVMRVMPDASDLLLSRTTVTLVTDKGMQRVPRKVWHVARPHSGVKVVIRVLPGKSGFKSLLQLFVSIAAIALGQFWAAPLAGFIGVSTQIASTLIVTAVTTLGALLLNALFRTPDNSNDTEKPTFAISGWRNRAAPDATVPSVLGHMRIAPSFAAPPYMEVVGNNQYVRALLCVGRGEYDISDIRIGETSIDEFDEVELEILPGTDADPKPELYRETVIEEQYNVTLTRDYPRNDYGDIIAGSETVLVRQVRVTAADAQAARIIVGFPQGLYFTSKKDGDIMANNQYLQIRYRAIGTSVWTEFDRPAITAKVTQPFFRAFLIKFPVRGRYEVEVTRLARENTSNRFVNTVAWAAMQTLRPEYPIAFTKPLALIAIRVKATAQLNGSLDGVNCLAKQKITSFDGTNWQPKQVSNWPADLFRHVLQNDWAYPVSDAMIDLEALAEWHDFCVAKGLRYNRNHDFSGSVLQTLQSIAAAGRASPVYDGSKWSIIIDQPRTLVAEHISTRNAWGIKWSRQYVKPPEGFRVSFLDETNEFQPAERLIPWPDHVGPINITEDLPMPGKTDPAEIWLEARRVQHASMLRPDRFTAIQDGSVRSATRGDLVMLNFDILASQQRVGSVKAIDGPIVQLDETITMVEGENYAVRFRTDLSDVSLGESRVVGVETIAGDTDFVILNDATHMPTIGSLIHFGVAGYESEAAIVLGTEAGEDMTTVVHLTNAAPEIDLLMESEVAPAWDGRVGEILSVPNTVPALPKIINIASGLSGTEEAGRLEVSVVPGTGNIIEIGSYVFEHRIVGAATYTEAIVTAGSGTLSVTGNATGAQIEVRVKAVSIYGYESAFTNSIIITIGSSDAATSSAIIGASVSVNGGLGHAVMVLTSGDSTKAIRVFRKSGIGGTLDQSTDFVRDIGWQSNFTSSFIDGDGSRTSLIKNGSFDTADTWTATNFAIGSGKATSAGAGSASSLKQPMLISDATTYVISFDIAARSSGSVRPRFNGGTVVTGTSQTANGFTSQELSGLFGNDEFELAGTTTFNGSVDNVSAYEKTTACLPVGDYTWWFAPLNDDDFLGPVSGPYVSKVR